MSRLINPGSRIVLVACPIRDSKLRSMTSTTTVQPYSPKVAVVTGAARGIGQAIALRLANDGLDIVLNDLPSHKTELDELVTRIQNLGRRSVAFTADVTQENDVQSLIENAAKEMGGIDVMVANAGIGRNSPLISTSVAEWECVQTVNVKGVFLCYREAAKQMIQQGRGGRIIGAGSRAGKQVQTPNWSAYVASKFAVRGLTQAAAVELAPHGITVNSYAPGMIRTKLWNEVDESRVAHGLPTIKDRIVDNTPEELAQFVGEVEDVAGLVSYLVRPESKFITGQSISINGGGFMD